MRIIFSTITRHPYQPHPAILTFNFLFWTQSWLLVIFVCHVVIYTVYFTRVLLLHNVWLHSTLSSPKVERGHYFIQWQTTCSVLPPTCFWDRNHLDLTYVSGFKSLLGLVLGVRSCLLQVDCSGFFFSRNSSDTIHFRLHLNCNATRFCFTLPLGGFQQYQLVLTFT